MKTDTPTLRERFRATFRATLKTSTGVSEFLADSNTSYIYWLESELAAVTEQLKAAQDGWHDEITKGLSELRRAESIYTKAQERAERAEEQRDEARREAEKYRNLITNVKGWKYDLPWEKPDAVKGGSDEIRS